jgi:hypothetical protein
MMEVRYMKDGVRKLYVNFSDDSNDSDYEDKKPELLFYVLLLYTCVQYTQPAQYPTTSKKIAGYMN